MRKDTRITVRAATPFYQQVQARAAREGRTVTQVILGLLAAWLQGKASPAE